MAEQESLVLTGKRNWKPSKLYIGSDSEEDLRALDPKRKSQGPLLTKLGLKSKRLDKHAAKMKKNYLNSKDQKNNLRSS